MDGIQSPHLVGDSEQSQGEKEEILKRAELARLIGVSPHRLTPIPTMTCTRLFNAIRESPFFIKEEGLSFRSLMRTHNVGARSATALCRALGLSTKLVPSKKEHPPKMGYDPCDIAEDLAGMVKLDAQVVSHSIHMLGSPDLVVVSFTGEKFKVSVEKIK